MDKELMDQLKGLELLDYEIKEDRVKCEMCFDLCSKYLKLMFPSSTGGVANIRSCYTCAEKVIDKPAMDRIQQYMFSDSKQEVKDEIRKRASLPEITEKSSKADVEMFLEDLSMKEPEFFKNLEEFSAGNYTLDNGQEDTMLKSISERVFSGRIPTEKQVKAFNGRCSHYLVRKREGEPLVDPISERMNGKQVDDIFTFFNLAKGLSSKAREISNGMEDQYERKGYISQKQYKYLQSLKRDYEEGK